MSAPVPPPHSNNNDPDRSLHWHILGGNNKYRIGMNSGLCVYTETAADGTQQKRALLFDIGSLAVDPRAPEDPALADFDTAIPDITPYLEKPDDPSHRPETVLDSIFLTHNHSDHIGAIPYLLLMGYRLPKIYATPYTARRLEQELSNAGLDPAEWPQIYTIAPGRAVEEGPVSVSAFWVSHSTPQCVGYFVETPAGNILAPGDFKLDQTVVWGPAFNETQYRKMMEKPVDLLLMDSTGADRDVEPVTEKDVRNALRKLMRENPDKRFVVAVMSGFEENMASVAKVSAESGRQLWVGGWSHEQALAALRDTGLSLGDTIDADIRVQVLTNARSGRSLAETPPAQATVVVTGAQGMPHAALTRAAEGSHPALKLDPEKDVILFCAPSIPGQEASHERLKANLRNQGFQVVTRREMPLYSQAHARLPELKRMAEMTRAKTVVPAHGDTRLRTACAQAMRAMGQRVLTAENGDTISIRKRFCKVAARVPDAEGCVENKVIAFKTMQGATWQDKNYMMARLPVDRKVLGAPKPPNSRRPKIFNVGK